MLDPQELEQDSIQSLRLSHLVLTLIILYFGQLVEDLYLKERRSKVVCLQRELYHMELKCEYQRMEEEQLVEELKLAKAIETLKKDQDDLKSQLDEDELEDSDWSADSDSKKKSESPNPSVAPADPASLEPNDEHGELVDELQVVKNNASELERTEDEIEKFAKDLGEEICNTELEATRMRQLESLESELDELREKMSTLEVVNDDLKKQIREHERIGLMSTRTSLDSSLVEYLERHNDELSLDFLQKAYKTLEELKELNPDRNFSELIDEMRSSHLDHAAHLAELQVSKKEVEIKLRLLKQRYEEELSTFNETKIEHLLKNSGAKEYLDRLKERNRLNDDLINDLRSELELKNRELTKWETRFREAEKQSQVYWDAWRDVQMKMAELEAEKLANHERSRRLAKHSSMNFSPSSSLIDDQVPPPPPVSIPSIDELLQATSVPKATTYAVKLDSSVPPPPPVDDEDILRETIPYNSSLPGSYMQSL